MSPLCFGLKAEQSTTEYLNCASDIEAAQDWFYTVVVRE